MMWRFVDHQDVDMTNNLVEGQYVNLLPIAKSFYLLGLVGDMLFLERMLSLFLSVNQWIIILSSPCFYASTINVVV